MRIRRIVQTSELVLPAHATIRRRSPRPPERRQENYDELFDSQTVFCDAFMIGERIVLVGPPLLNLEELFLGATYTIDGQSLQQRPLTHRLDRAHRLEIPWGMGADDLTVRYGEYAATLRVRADLSQPLVGKTVLLAMQRNNPLHWLRDWARFFIAINKVNGIVLYDMASTEYDASGLIAALDDLPGLDSLIVVNWPYKYGVQPASAGQPWDSDFCQYVAWEHARLRFLQQAEAVTIADVDELFLAEDFRTIFEHAAESASGAIYFQQRFMSLWWTGSLRTAKGKLIPTIFITIRRFPTERRNSWPCRPCSRRNGSCSSTPFEVTKVRSTRTLSVDSSNR